MPRISDEQLARLKTDISLVRLIESQGHELKVEGKDHVMCCPFHDDDTPSMKISADKNVFHCFGCGASGTVIDWVMKTQGVSFRHACEILINDAGMQLDDAGVTKRNSVPKLESPLSLGADDQLVLNQVINYYHNVLLESVEAQDYLKARGLYDSDAIKHFKLGFANRTLGFRLPMANRRDGKAIRSQLQDIGVFRSSGHEHFNGSIVIPVADDELGNVTEVYGRKIRNNLRKGTPKHLYLPGPHVGVFNAKGLRMDMEVILCESLIDALTFWVNGYRNVTCCYGTAGFTDDHLAAFRKYNIRRVLIAFDRDKAGNEAAVKLSEQLNAEGFDTYRILFPKGMDANEYALSVTPAEKSLGVVIRKAEWMGNGVEIEGSNQVEPAVEPSSTEPLAYDIETATKEETSYASLAADDIPEPSAAVQPTDAELLDDMHVETSEHEVNIILAARTYRVRGMNKNMSYAQLKVNLLVSTQGQLLSDN